MKKANLLITILLGLALFNGLAFGADVTNPNSNCQVRQNGGQIQIDLKGQEIAPTSSIYFDFDWIGEWDAVQHRYAAISTGNIPTTANLSWRQHPASTGTEVLSETLTVGTPVVILPTGSLRYTLYNFVAETAYVTGSILISNN